MSSGTTPPPGSPGIGKCPVYFCGTPQGMMGFSTLFSNAQKMSAIEAIGVPTVPQTLEKTKDVEYGIIILLVEAKNDLIAVLNVLVALRKRIDKGALRVLAYSGLDSDRVASVLKSKGCAETFLDGLTQKALVHKLQKHLQIVGTKAKTLKKAQDVDASKLKTTVKKTERLSSEDAQLRYVPALIDANDCWLIKNKKDFKFIRGNWIGEMIGPGPAVGTWTEAGGTTKQPIYRWTSRKETDPFVPGKGSWYFSGRKPDFDWKINRWRFVGETPSLFYKAADAPAGSGAVFRFRSSSPGLIEVALNSAAAKTKLKAIVATFDDQKLIKDEKAKAAEGPEISVEKEKKAGGGADYEKDAEADDDADDWEDLDLGEEEKPKWGELKESKEKEREWGDRSDEGEDEEGPDWTGLDVGRGNKFSGGRGVGQGEGGKKGYKYDEEEDGEPGSEEDPQHDWTGLDVGRGNKFESGRGLGQGEGGDQGYDYEKEKKGARGGSGDEDLDEDLDDEDFDLGDGEKPARGKSSGSEAARRKADPSVSVEARQKKLEAGAGLDEMLGDPDDDPEWDTGADAFDKITLDITVSRPDQPGSPSLNDVSLIERRGSDLLLDAPAKTFKTGERMSFAIVLGEAREKRKLQLNGTLMSAEPSGDDRDAILVSVTEISRAHLAEIQSVFERRQAQLLKFLREAKG